MNLKLPFLLVLLAGMALVNKTAAQRADDSPKLYEMRTYYCEPGRLDALLARFRDHTMQLFEKHGMTNVGYWVPIDNTDNKLVYVLSYPGERDYRDKAWKAFGSDPAWKAAKENSEKDGKIVNRVENMFMHETDFSFPMKVKKRGADQRIYELRTYHINPDKLPNLLARFRDHTTALFAKQGMTNLNYWVPDERTDRLVYILAHPSLADAKKAFAAFREDPDWIKARDASERDGKLVSEVESTYLKATDFSPIR